MYTNKTSNGNNTNVFQILTIASRFGNLYFLNLVDLTNNKKIYYKINSSE